MRVYVNARMYVPMRSCNSHCNACLICVCVCACKCLFVWLYVWKCTHTRTSVLWVAWKQRVTLETCLEEGPEIILTCDLLISWRLCSWPAKEASTYVRVATSGKGQKVRTCASALSSVLCSTLKGTKQAMYKLRRRVRAAASANWKETVKNSKSKQRTEVPSSCEQQN